MKHVSASAPLPDSAGADKRRALVRLEQRPRRGGGLRPPAGRERTRLIAQLAREADGRDALRRAA